MAPMPSTEWARRLGALLLKPLTASWSGSDTNPTEYKVAAQCFAPNGRLPSDCSHSGLIGPTPASPSRSIDPGLLASRQGFKKEEAESLTNKSPYKEL